MAVGQITRICKLGLLPLAAVAVSMPAMAGIDDDDAAYYVEARLAEVRRDDASALLAYRDLIRTGGYDAVVADNLFDVAIRLGEKDFAILAAQTGGLNPESAEEGQMLLFTDAIVRRKWRAAEQHLAKIREGEVYSFLAPIYEAWLRQRQGKDYDLPDFGEGSSENFNFYSYDQYVYFAIGRGDATSARQVMENLLASDLPFVRDIAIRMAPVFAAQGNRKFAEQLLAGRVEPQLSPNILADGKRAKIGSVEGLANLHVRLARGLSEQGLSDRALICARIAHWLDSENIPGTLLLAQLLGNAGLKEQAGVLLDRIDAETPYWLQAVNDGANLLTSEGDFDKAVVFVEAAASRRPKSENLALLLGQMKQRAGDVDGAIAIYLGLISAAEQTNNLSGLYPDYHFLAGVAYHALDNWAMARKYLEKASRLAPENASLLNYLGYSLLDRKEDIETGLTLVRRAYILKPDSPEISDSLGWAYFLKGEFARAVPLLEKAVRGSGNDREINEHLGDAYWLSGRFVDARYAWRVAAQLARGTDLVRLSGKIDNGIVAAAVAE